ncbi:MAG: oligosaccharide flippase family protein [Anaeromyxobacter sp.]|nr:oligosaccharide flippase family protein [Anaeromyxobacter sp.]
MSRRQATRLNLFFQYASIGLTVLQGFVLVPFYLRYIDGATYGAWLASGNIVAWLAVVDPGFGAVLQQRVARFLGEGSSRQLGDAVGTGVTLSLAIAGLVAAAGLALAPWVPELTGSAGGSGPELTRAFALSCAAEAVLLVDLAVAAVLVGLMKRMVWTGVSYLAGTLLGVVATVVLLVGGFGLSSIPLGLLLRSVLLLLSHGALLAHVLRRDLRVAPRFTSAEFRSVMSLSAFTWAARLATSLMGNVDALLVSRYFGPAQVTAYVLTKRASEVLAMVVTRVGAAFAPAMAHAWGAGGGESLRLIALRLLRLATWASLFGLAGYAALNREFMGLWVGPQLYGGLVLTVLLGLAAAVLSVESIASSILFSVGGARASSAATATSAVGRFVAALGLLAAGGGAWSVPLAAAAVSLSVTLGMILPILSRTLGSQARGFALDLLKSGAQALPMVALGLVWARWFAPLAGGSWLGFAFGAAALSTALVSLLAASCGSFRSEVRRAATWLQP